MRLSVLRKWLTGLLIGSLALSALGGLLSRDPDLQVVSMILILGGVALLIGVGIARLFWKCPHCKSLLPWRDGGSEIVDCPYCGKDVGND